jgi:hypothetical protein
LRANSQQNEPLIILRQDGNGQVIDSQIYQFIVNYKQVLSGKAQQVCIIVTFGELALSWVYPKICI